MIVIFLQFLCEQDWSSNSSTIETITTESPRERKRRRAAPHSFGASEVAEAATKHVHNTSCEEPFCRPGARRALALLVAGEDHR